MQVFIGIQVSVSALARTKFHYHNDLGGICRIISRELKDQKVLEFSRNINSPLNFNLRKRTWDLPQV